ncbi:MAG: hypothetical protein H6839_17750 [Planctomycetes bacterium]|nr:hypothetical protein [Planctomycetota bacterium]
MPINLRYGQQAVARGYLNKARLDQVLAKQKQLAAQGKKVSVRMILEKAKLLDREQLAEIDRDLNIKVVKKHTTRVQKPGVKPPAGRAGAQNFAGEAVPQFSGMTGADPDATVFSPPPADMQQKIRAERDRAKADARARQEQEASEFFGDDASPFGGDPFGGGDMAPEPFGSEMAPEPFGGDMQPEPFGGEMQPEPFGNEMQPEPFGDEMQPEPMGFHSDPFGGGELAPDDGGFGNDAGPFDDPYGDSGFGGAPQELSRQDSSPKLSSLAAEYDNFASPDDEALPTINAFDDAGPDQGFQSGPPPMQHAGPSLAPADDDFGSFGNDIRSPEELESAPVGRKGPAGGDNMDATMFSPPPPGFGNSPRQKTGAMDRTVFSPRPPEMGGPPPMDAEPAGDDWGEEPAMDAGPDFGDDSPFGGGPSFDDEEPAGANMEATLFSPPPAQMPPSRRDTGRQQPSARGRQGADDFGDVDIPQGKVIDDIPTSPASMDDDVHPLRRGVGTSSASIKQDTRPQPTFDDDVADELPDDGGVDMPDDVPDEMPEEDEGSPRIGKGKGKLPSKAPVKAKPSKRELPQKEVPATDGEAKPKKSAGKRVLLIFTILLLVVVAILTLPIVLYDVEEAKFVRDIRDNPQAKPVYDYVDYEIFNRIREWTQQPLKKKPEGPKPFTIPTAPPDNSADTPPAPNSDDGAAPEDAGGG